MTDAPSRREEIARIIDPGAFHFHPQDGSLVNRRRYEDALAKADAILATDGWEIVKELAAATELLTVWFEGSGASIRARWERIPPEQCSQIVRALRQAHAKAKDWLEGR